MTSHPKIVGLTGGIGSGKTTIGTFFSNLGVPIYVADKEAKLLMVSDNTIKAKIYELFGAQSYKNNHTLNTNYIASKIFKNNTLLNAMNAIVHPKVAEHFEQWLVQQSTAYVIKEAAIIFEHKQQDNYNYIITVIASKEDRIQRILKRPDMTQKKAETIMSKQLPDTEKTKLSDFVIINKTLNSAKQSAINIHNTLLSKINNSK